MLAWRILLVLLFSCLVDVDVLAEPANVVVGDLTFTRPEKWTWTEFTKSTALVRFIVPNGADGDSSTDVRFYMTDRTPTQSINRWKSYFSPEERRSAHEERKTIGGREIISMTLRGTFKFPGLKIQPGYRFVATLVPTGKQFIIVRLVGPDRDAEKATDDYRKMIEAALKESGEK